MHTDALAVLDFWFGPTDDPGHAQPRAAWFKKDDAFDAQIVQRFGPLIERALLGDIDDWLARPVEPLPALARVIVLDQFTRNAFRGTARAFAGDGMALQTARALVATGADQAAMEAAARADEKIAELLSGKTIVKTIIVPGKMVNFVVR